MDDIRTDTEEANNNGATGGENISDCWGLYGQKRDPGLSLVE